MNKPKIRFKGFEGEWKRQSLGDISASFSGGTPAVSVSDYYGGNIPFIRSGEIHENRTQLYITQAGLNNSSAKIVEKGTILYALYGATSGDVGFSKLRGAINQAILAIEPTKKYIDRIFLVGFLQSYKHRIINELLQGGQGNLSGSLVKKILLAFPSLPEQRALASYFTSLDAQIAASASRLSSLKQIKAASLLNMFPQKGETVPRVRFKGFQGEWKERKLGEVFSERVENNINGQLLSVTLNKGIIRASENGKLDNSNSDKSKYKVVNINDIAYNSMRMWQGASGCSKYEGIVSPAYTVITPKEDIDSSFFSYLFKTDIAINKFRLHSQGLTSDNWNLKYPAFSKIDVYCPLDISEQRAIASYFTALDAQITLHRERLEKLKQIKAACLEKMFA